MPETARIIQFPARREGRPYLSAQEAETIAYRFLETPPAHRSEDVVTSCLAEPDALLIALRVLRDRSDSDPSAVLEEARGVYEWLTQDGGTSSLFDEHEYFLGEAAFLAGGACRLVGKLDDAELWFDRAEAAFRHTVNPAPLLANVSYGRLTLYYDRKSYPRIFELLPSLTASFKRLGMEAEELKCRFLGAMALKNSARFEQARETLQALRSHPGLTRSKVRALVLVHLGELLSSEGRYSDAVSLYREALSIQGVEQQPLVMAHLKGVMGEALRQQGFLAEAVEAYRGAVREYRQAGMRTLEAYLRVVVAENLMALSRSREAEWEILQALPTIDEQKMVPEGFAALALLKESVRQRKADPDALRQLREHLQANEN